MIELKKVVMFFTLLMFSMLVLADGSVKIGLISLDRPLSITVKICSGNYIMEADGQSLVINEYDNILMVRAGGKILLSTSRYNTVLADSVVLVPGEGDNYFSLRNNLHAEIEREYSGKLVVKSDLASLSVINEVSVVDYLRAVVQAEAGFKGGVEYFKTQALLARTYLYMHFFKHVRDGYNLCDETDCQVYHGRSESIIIKEAVEETAGLVLVNTDSMLVFTPFHSNCGGRTESPENVWLKSMPHVSEVTDPYCNFSRNAKWIKKIDKDEWINYLRSHGYEHNNDSDLAFEQLSRKRYYRAGDFSYALTRIREEWSLKSAFFSLEPGNGIVILKGRGYGHGVGLCQEGARGMAERGFNMKEIIEFYFHDLLIIDKNDVRPASVINSAF